MTAKIKVLTVDDAELPFTPAAGRAVELKPAEAKTLVEAGIWQSPSDPDGWTAASADGEVYAGRGECGPGATYAKVRGKGGRRLGQGRWAKEAEEKRQRVSFAILPAVRRRLVELSAGYGLTHGQALEDIVMNVALSPEKRARLMAIAEERGVTVLEALEAMIPDA